MTVEPYFVATITGTIPSKKNAWKRGKDRMFLDEGITAELQGLLFQLLSTRNRKGMREALQGPVRIEAVFQVPKARYDLDNAYTTLQDLLEKARVIANDRQVWKYSVERQILPGEPMTVVRVYNI